MPKTPEVITVQRLISRATVEKLFSSNELQLLPLHAEMYIKPQPDFFHCVFVFSVRRLNPGTLKIRVISTVVSRIQRYTVKMLRDRAPEIQERDMWAEVFYAHFIAEDNLNLDKLNTGHIPGLMSKFTRWFMDNGAGDRREPPEFIIHDPDFEVQPPALKVGPVLVQ
ncbi:MAG: hypothetical protein JO217_13580 [Acidobacteriaceae bacterium]|nr:hypothetical protein [Acidobacteriaceae bacterium]MBV9443706.1 hypothetical protein [Acidobacteriaceae bacterium]